MQPFGTNWLTVRLSKRHVASSSDSDLRNYRGGSAIWQDPITFLYSCCHRMGHRHGKDMSVLNQLTVVLRDVFDDDTLVATPDLTANRVNGWDSLGNVRLFIEIERTFAVRFSATEMTSLKNVGELTELIERKTRPL